MTTEAEDNGKKETLVAIQQAWISESAIAELEDAAFGKAYVRLPERQLRKVEEP